MNVQMLVRIGLLYLVKKIEIVYFVSLVVEHVPEEIKEFIGNKKKHQCKHFSSTIRQFNNVRILLHRIH